MSTLFLIVQNTICSTDLNPADLFTKVLGRQPFEKFRRMVLNLAGGDAVEQLRRAGSSPAPPSASTVARKQKELAKMAALLV